ncbi:hypothetical protein GCM10023318_33780 [Nocardia callitridis]|uniref:IrrE N-terminal-like domain-containing protein n=2 Tax=Nocardia callitridis TaxID=648753 RepID=A0ABP9KGK7_9NOCA
MEARFGTTTQTVPLPNPWNLTAYLAAVAAHRGRSISVRTAPKAMLTELGCRVGGLWIARAHDDIIVYDAEAADRAAEHIVLHVVGHMLLGHRGDHENNDDTERLSSSLSGLLPSLSIHNVKQVLGRNEFGADPERDAEVFADMTLVYATLPRRRSRSFRLFGRGK